MSMSLMAKAMSIKVGNPLRKLVLLKLADNANDKREAWPSIPYIAQQCEMAERTVQSHVHALQKSGFLWVEKRKGSNGINQSNVYHLTLNKGEGGAWDSSEFPASSGGENAAPYGESPAPRGANAAPGDGANAAPRISHSFEPVIEPKTPLPPTGGISPEPAGKNQTPKPKPDQLPTQDYQAALAIYNVTVPLTESQKATLASFVYNVGSGAFERSTLLKKLNAGDIAGACDEMRRWKYVDGKVSKGLVSRRAVERERCLKSL